jgi:hypothetical protein
MDCYSMNRRFSSFMALGPLSSGYGVDETGGAAAGQASSWSSPGSMLMKDIKQYRNVEHRPMSSPPFAGAFGSAVGRTGGASGGGPASKLMGEELNPAGADAYWRTAYRSEPYFSKLYGYEDYAPAYRTAHAHRLANFEGAWEQAEAELKSGWEKVKHTSRLQWDEARHAARAAWHRAKRPTPPPPEKNSALA